MAINERLIHTAAEAAAGASSAEQNLILHLDANDVDSYDGDGSVWYDISEHDVTIPLSDNADNLKVHYNPSDTDSYSGTGTTMSNLAGSSLDATVVASRFDIDNGGFFDVSTDSEATIAVPTGHPLNGTNFTLEFWFNWTATPIAANRFIYESGTGWNFFYYKNYGWRISNADVSTGYFKNGSYITAGQWYHCVIAQDSSNCKIYFDGELVKTQSVTSGTRSLGAFNFGSTDIAADKPKCKIGAIRMYNSTLSASEIGQNYRHGRDYIYTDLVDDTNLHLHFDAADLTSAANTTWTDKVGSVALTKSGTVSYDDELGDFIDFGGGYYANDSHTSSFEDSSGNTTVEFWYSFDSLSAQNAIIQFRNATGSRWHIGTASSEFISYYYGATGIQDLDVTLSGTLGISSTGKWYHIAVVKTEANQKVYVDGVLKTTHVDAVTGGANSITGIRIGDVHYISGYGSDGQLGQLRVYKDALTADEVMQNYLYTKNDYPNSFHLDGTNMDNNDWNSGGYFDFNGNNEYFYKNDYPVDFGTSDYTVILWFNSDTNNSNKALFATYNSSGLMIDLRSDGTIRHYHDGGTTLQYYTSETISSGTWYQLAVTFDRSNDTGSMYLSTKSTFDSAASTGTASSGATNKGNGGTNVGRYNSGFYYDGKMANVRVYDKALSSSEIQEVWNTDKGKIPT